MYITVKDAEGCKLCTYLSLEHFRYFWIFEFLQVLSDAETLRDALDRERRIDLGSQTKV